MRVCKAQKTIAVYKSGGDNRRKRGTMRRAMFTFMLCAMLTAGAAAQTLESIPIRVSLAPDAGDGTAIEDRLSPAPSWGMDNLDSLSVTDKAIAVMGVAAPANIISNLDNFLSRTEDKYSLYQLREAYYGTLKVMTQITDSKKRGDDGNYIELGEKMMSLRTAIGWVRDMYTFRDNSTKQSLTDACTGLFDNAKPLIALKKVAERQRKAYDEYMDALSASSAGNKAPLKALQKKYKALYDAGEVRGDGGKIGLDTLKRIYDEEVLHKK